MVQHDAEFGGGRVGRRERAAREDGDLLDGWVAQELTQGFGSGGARCSYILAQSWLTGSGWGRELCVPVRTMRVICNGGGGYRVRSVPRGVEGWCSAGESEGSVGGYAMRYPSTAAASVANSIHYPLLTETSRGRLGRGHQAQLGRVDGSKECGKGAWGGTSSKTRKMVAV